MPGALTDFLIFPGVVIAIGVVMVGAAWYRMRLHRTRHLQRREPMPDEAFLAEMAAPHGQRRVCLAIRKAMADAAGIPPDSIHPSDSMESLCALGFDGIDLIEIIIELERRLGLHIDDRELDKTYGGKNPMRMTFAEFASCFLDNPAIE